MKASFEPYILKFKNPSGTSRGVLTEKLTYLFTLEEDGKLFANLFDGEGSITAFEVKLNEVVIFDIKINYKAHY